MSGEVFITILFVSIWLYSKLSAIGRSCDRIADELEKLRTMAERKR